MLVGWIALVFSKEIGDGGNVRAGTLTEPLEAAKELLHLKYGGWRCWAWWWLYFVDGVSSTIWSGNRISVVEIRHIGEGVDEGGLGEVDG